MLLFAFIYPPAMAEAKDIGSRDWVENGLNTQLTEQVVELETNLAAGDTSQEILLAQRHNRRRYRHGRRRYRQHYHGRRRYPRSYYRGQYYRHGRWQRVRDRHGRLMYDWRRY